MGENMNGRTDFDPSSVVVKIHEAPIKLVGDVTMLPDAVQQQAEHAKRSLAQVDYETTPGTCGDERERVGLKSGEAIVAPRPSIWGGPDIYGHYVSVMSGVFTDPDMTADEQLKAVVDVNKQKNIPSGGHEHCAAAGSFGVVLKKIAENRGSASSYAQENLEDYDPTVMDEVFDAVETTVASGRYDDWDGEAALGVILGSDADQAIERLAPVPHEGRTFIRVNRPGYTVDQTTLHDISGGEDSFVQDDPYADKIEHAHARDERMKRVMEHAREALIVGISLAVPNMELHQIDIS